MRGNPKIKRVQLNVSHDDGLFLAGIVSSEPDYKLSLNINRKLRISLKNISPLMVPDKSGNPVAFTRFSDHNAPQGVVFSLVSNRCGKNFIIKKLQNIDYLLQVQDPENDINTDELITLLKETDSVTAVFNIDRNTVKDKNLDYLIL